MLQEKEKKMASEILKDLSHPVKLINFTQEFECRFCHETRRLLQEVSVFSHLVRKHQIMVVPKTLMNEEFSLVGAIPEGKMLEEITKAVSSVV